MEGCQSSFLQLTGLTGEEAGAGQRGFLYYLLFLSFILTPVVLSVSFSLTTAWEFKQLISGCFHALTSNTSLWAKGRRNEGCTQLPISMGSEPLPAALWSPVSLLRATAPPQGCGSSWLISKPCCCPFLSCSPSCTESSAKILVWSSTCSKSLTLCSPSGTENSGNAGVCLSGKIFCKPDRVFWA